MDIIGVKFPGNDYVYDFDGGDLDLHLHDQVVVETKRGKGIGVVATKRSENGAFPDKPLKKIVRRADENDLYLEMKNHGKEKETYKTCLKEIVKYNLPMKLVKAEHFSDGSKLLFYFTAESRIDFRELVKSLAQKFHTRIEMRQIGVRNETKMLGGIGNCGRGFCCSTFLKDFEPVSVRIAKDQNLALNPAKISGVCGRLMCCLTYEHGAYVACKKGMPKCGSMVNASQGKGKVIEQNIMEEKVTIRLEDGTEVKVAVEEIKEEVVPRKSKKKRGHR